ncbi:MAG: hypothetical protein LBB23_01350 [Rickettsiales bacterium]|jgi:hypothetical protein|nr:hypothetical protein [Rickettsiales bacterium]
MTAPFGAVLLAGCARDFKPQPRLRGADKNWRGIFIITTPALRATPSPAKGTLEHTTAKGFSVGIFLAYP